VAYPRLRVCVKQKTDSLMTSKHLVIHGSVQGVFYRAWTGQTALSLGLDGWVRNVTDGTVEVLVYGPDDAVNRLIELCRNGPPAASVTKIDISEAEYDGAEGFEQRPTAYSHSNE